MSNHQDRVAEADAEKRNEPNHATQGQQPAGGKYGQHAPDQGKRQVRQHQQQIAPIAGDDRQQKRDADGCNQRIDHKVALGPRFCLGRTGKLDVSSSREFDLGADIGLCRFDEGNEIGAGNIGGHRLHATRSLVQDLIASRSLIDIRDLLEQNISTAGAAHGQVADFGDIVPAGSVEYRHDVEYLIAFIGLADDVALIGGTDQFEHLDRVETPTLQIGFAKTDRELRHAGRRLHLNVRRARGLLQRPGNLLRLAIEQVEVVAEDVDRKRGRVAREGFLDTLSEKSHDSGVHADETRERSADIRLRLFGVVSRQTRIQIHFELAVVRTPAILGFLRSSHTLRNRAHLVQLSQGVGDTGADAQRLVDGRAGHRGHVDDEMPLLQLRNEAATEKRQRGTAGNRQHRRCSNQRPGPLREPPQEPLIAGSRPSDHRRIPRRHPIREKRHGKRWCHGQRDRQRGKHRHAIGQT